MTHRSSLVNPEQNVWSTATAWRSMLVGSGSAVVTRGAYMPATAVEVSLCSETGARECSSGPQKSEIIVKLLTSKIATFSVFTDKDTLLNSLHSILLVPEKRHISASSEGRIGPNSRVGAPPLSSRLRGPPRNRKSSGGILLRCCYTIPKASNTTA